MPKAGMAMESGVIHRWHKQPGDTVCKGDLLLEIETDKVTMEVEAEVSGVLLAALYPEGSTVAVIETIAWIGAPGEAAPASAAAAAAANPGAATPDAEPASQARSPHPEGRIPATPAAKRLARERGIDLCRATASGPHGELRVRDIEALAADVEQAAACQPLRVPLSGMRKLIAQRMSQSRAEIPDATLQLSADVTALFEYRARLKQQGVSVTVNDLLLRATAIALGEFPFINATFEQDTILCWPDVNLGLAVAVENGLVVPVLHRIQQLPLAQLSALARDTVSKARSGALLPDDFLNGTFTVTNLGMLGIERFTPIINPPQTAILGVCATEDRPLLLDGQLVWRKMMGLCLTHDHRVIDGALGAAFLNRIKELLATPHNL